MGDVVVSGPSACTNELTDKVAIVSGASRGIGREIARAYALSGATVVLLARDGEAIAALAADLCAVGSRAIPIATDVSDEDQCSGAVARTMEDCGRIDVLVNCASINRAGLFVDTSPQEFHAVMQVGLFGAIYLTQRSLPDMLERGSGSIVNVASTAGMRPSKFHSPYSVSKHALIGLTRCVALETAARGVRVNAICPGPVNTDMLREIIAQRSELMELSADEVLSRIVQKVPIGCLIEPEDVARLAVYLASDVSRHMTGQTIGLDGGVSLA